MICSYFTIFFFYLLVKYVCIKHKLKSIISSSSSEKSGSLGEQHCVGCNWPSNATYFLT